MRLGVYLNPAMKLRESGNRGDPDPATVAALAEMAGAGLVLIGWNPEGGLVCEKDVRRVRETLQADLLLVVPARAGIADRVAQISPHGVVLIDPSWDGVRALQPVQAAVQPDLLGEIAEGFKSAGIPSSILIEPDLQNVKAASRAGLTGVILDCSKFSRAASDEEAESTLGELENAALAAGKFGLLTAFGHGLNYRNTGYIAALPSAVEFYAGTAVMQRALLVGLDVAVRDLCQIIFRYNR